MKPRISIIIPSYNQGRYIEQTISSILESAYPNLELIIIDGGSTDETVEVIKKYASKVDYWVSEPDKGQAHAINKGLAVATGEVFNWINSDDLLETGSLEAIGDFFEQHADKDVLCGFTRCFWDEDNSTSHEYRMGIKKTVSETIFQVEMNQPGTFFKTSIVKELGGVNETLRYVFDDELWFRYLCKYGSERTAFINKRFAHFRLHGKSKSVGEGYSGFHIEINSLYADILNYCNPPFWMQEYLKSNGVSEKYKSKGDWNILSLETDLFKALFARKYINTLYLQNRRTEARKAMQMIITNGLFVWNRVLLSLRIKLLF